VAGLALGAIVGLPILTFGFPALVLGAAGVLAGLVIGAVAWRRATA
jgi:hypothetical protein